MVAPEAPGPVVGLPAVGTATGAAGPFAGREFYGPNAGALEAYLTTAANEPVVSAIIAFAGASAGARAGSLPEELIA